MNTVLCKILVLSMMVFLGANAYGLGPLLCNPSLPELRAATLDGKQRRRLLLRANPPLTINDYNVQADQYCRARYSSDPNTHGKGDYCRYQYCMAGLEAVIRM